MRKRSYMFPRKPKIEDIDHSFLRGSVALWKSPLFFSEKDKAWVHFLICSHVVYFLSACLSPTLPALLWYCDGPLVNLGKADYTEGGGMLEMWAWLNPAQIMMWTLIQRDGQRDCGLRDCASSGLRPGGCTAGSRLPSWPCSVSMPALVLMVWMLSRMCMQALSHLLCSILWKASCIWR